MSAAAEWPDVRALGGKVAIGEPGGDGILIRPHEALVMAQRLIDAAATAEGQTLLLRDLMGRGSTSGRIGRH